MNNDEFKFARELFDEICDAAPDEQRAAIDARCADRPEARRIIEILLAEDGIEDGTIDMSAMLPAEMQVVSALSAVTESTVPSSIGRYQIIRECGQGGMGTVYEAEQDSPRRRVALKMIRAGYMSPSMLRRFRYETEILGRLQHPGIGQIFEAGTIDLGEGGQPFFAMEFIEGRPLTAYAELYELSTTDRLELMARVCDAVHYAHQRGVIHRDLKPANILVMTADTSASASGTAIGQPKILDFGVARVTDSDVEVTTMHTQVGQLVGTLQYMSPEQAAGDTSTLDTRSDIYALGIVLYQLLTGHVPYDLRDQAVPQCLRMIQETPPSRLSTFGAEFRGDLETIVSKCLEKEIDRRYQSASELAEDIRRFVRDEPITARPPSALYQFRKFRRRNRALVGGVLATAIVLVAGTVVSSILAVRAAGLARQSARSESEARAQAYRSAIIAAKSLINTAPRDAQRCLETAPEELRNWEWYHLLYSISEHHAALDPGGPIVGRPAVTPDGSVFAARTDGVIVRWAGGEADSLEVVARLETTVSVASFSADARRLAIVTPRGTVRVFDVEGNRVVTVPSLPSGPGTPAIAWSENGERLLAVRPDSIATWDGSQRWVTVPIETPFHPSQEFRSLAVVPGSTRVVILAGVKVVLMDITTGAVEATHSHFEQVTCVMPAPDGRTIAVGYQFRSVRLLDSETLDEVARPGAHLGSTLQVAFSSDGGSLCSTGDDHTVRIWDLERGTVRRVIRTDSPLAAFFSPAGTSVFCVTGPESYSAASLGRTIKRLGLTTPGSVVLYGHESYVYDVAWSVDGSRLASVAYQGSETRVWDTLNGQLLHDLDDMRGSGPVFARDGSLVSLGPHSVLVADPETGSIERHTAPAQYTLKHFIGYGDQLMSQAKIDMSIAHRVWRTEYSTRADDGFLRRAFVDGRLTVEAPDHVAPDYAGELARGLFIGEDLMTPYLFGGAIAELIIFRGPITDDEAAAIESFLAERRDAGTGRWPAPASASLVARFTANETTIRRDDAGRVEAWTALNDSDIVLRTIRGADIRLDRVGMNGHPTLTFAGGQMEGRLPEAGGSGNVTVFWLGHYENVHYPTTGPVIGPPELIGAALRQQLVSALQRPLEGLRFSNAESINVDGVMARAVSPRAILLGDLNGVYGRIPGHYECIAFHPTGRLLAAGTPSGVIEVRDVATCELVGTFEGHQGQVYGLDYSPDGSRLASGGNDMTVRLWDTANNLQVLELRGHEQYVKTVAFSPDGSQIASGSGDGTVRIWTASPPEDAGE